MSFAPIKFTYTPPPTIPPIAVLAPNTNVVGTTVPVSTEFGTIAAGASNAAALVTRLSNLSQTAAYLQQAILSLVPNLGITLDLASNPPLGQALSRIYNVTIPPPAINMSMYTNLLQTSTSFTQFDLMNPSDSSVQILPTQRADVNLATKTFENTLISSGIYNQTLPVLMRSLSGDQVIFNSWSNTLMKYPILSVPQQTPAQLANTINLTGSSDRDLNGSSIDVSPALSEQMNGILDQWQSSYAGVYNLVATPDATETSLPSVVATLSTQPTSDLNRVVTMLQNLIAFQQQSQLQEAHDSVDNLVLPQLMSDVFSHTTNLDYMTQVAVMPSANFTGALGSLMSVMSGINPGTILNVGLTGTVAVSAGGYNPPPLTSSQSAALTGISSGLQMIGANITWSQNESNNQNTFIQTSLQRLSTRRMTNQGNQTELLTSLKSLSSTIGIIQALLQSGTNTPTPTGTISSLNTAPITPVPGLQSIGILISSLPSQSGSSYAIDGNTLTITPPQIPTAPVNVQTTLTTGGVNQITTQSLQTTVNLDV